jgi:hypothetical protein
MLVIDDAMVRPSSSSDHLAALDVEDHAVS